MPTLAFGKEDARLWFEIRVDDVSVATSGTHLAASGLKVMARFRFNHDQLRQAEDGCTIKTVVAGS